MSDLIDRQAVIDLLKQMRKDGDMVPWEGKDVFARIRKLPTIQPEPKEGHWKKDETDDCPPVFRQFRICSVCGAIETSETNYCPNCGAKMTNK